MSKGKTNKALLPKRHQPDFFVCDIFDATPKGDSASMEHPIFSLSSKPDRRVRRYEHGENYIEVKPSSDGLATVFDRDIIIFCISQIMAAKNKNAPVSQIVRFQAHDLLVATNRDTSGRGYEGLKCALERLRGTSISTNLSTGGIDQFKTFGLIDSAEIIRETRDGRMREIEVKLSDWVFNAINEKEVLTISPDYFRLRKTLERRIYEIARKHCGNQKSWKIGMELLRKKTGSKSNIWEFKRMLTNIIKENDKSDYFPDYLPILEKNNSEVFVLFKNKKYLKTKDKILKEEESTDDPCDKKNYEITLIDAGFQKEEIDIMKNYFSEDSLKESVEAASNYITSQQAKNKVIQSSVAIYRTAIKDNWKVSELKNDDSEENDLPELQMSDEAEIEDQQWKNVRMQFAQMKGIPTFISWIKDIKLEAKGEEEIILKAKTSFISDYVEKNFMKELQILWKSENPKIASVKIVY